MNSFWIGLILIHTLVVIFLYLYCKKTLDLLHRRNIEYTDNVERIQGKFRDIDKTHYKLMRIEAEFKGKIIECESVVDGLRQKSLRFDASIEALDKEVERRNAEKKPKAAPKKKAESKKK